MRKGRIVVGIAVALIVLTGAGHAWAGQSLQSKVEQKETKLQNSFGLPVESARCVHKPRLDFDHGYGHLKGFKCRARYIYGSDHWEYVWWLSRDQDLAQGESINTPWYNGDWYVDCRLNAKKGDCLKLGRRQVKLCMDLPVDRGYCHSLIYGDVNVKTGKPPRGAVPEIFSVVAGSSELGTIVGSGNCYPHDGISPPCVPDLPKTVSTRKFTTKIDGTVLSFGDVEVTGQALDAEPGGSAEVTAQLMLDGSPVSNLKRATVTGGETVSIPFEKRFFLVKGPHEVSVQISGAGSNHVNVAGDAARLKVFVTRFPRRN